MPTLSKMSVAEKDQLCQNIYEKYIFETSELLESCDGIAEILRTYIPSGCYTNFRDMLFHFRCLADANEEGIVLSQLASIVEHANRAMRDAEAALCVRCVTVFEVLKQRHDFDTEALEQINRQIERLQDFILKLRLGSMMLEGMELLSPSNEKFFDIMNAYFVCAETYAAQEFQEVIAYSKKLKDDFSTILKTAFETKEENEFRNFKAFATYNDMAELVYEAVLGVNQTG